MPGVNINVRLLLLYIYDDLMVMILAIQSIHDDRHIGNITNLYNFKTMSFTR